MTNKNGFEEAVKQLKTMINVDQKVAADALEEAAEFFATQLRKNIPRSRLNKADHLQENLNVKKEGDKYIVYFENAAWYWSLVDKGHKKRGGKGRVAGTHFVQKTLSAEETKISEIMVGKIMKKLGGN